MASSSNQPPGGAAPVPQPPSPWAAKFGFPPNSLPCLIENGHSSLSPQTPYLDPTWYGTYPPRASKLKTLKPIPAPIRTKAIDDLFAAERLQQSYLAGLRTWQATTLNARLAGGVYGGNDKEIPPPSIDVDTQRRILQMRRTGLLPPIEKADRSNAGMNALLMQMNMFLVSEGSWCKAFVRERWYDLDVRVRERLPDAIPEIGDDDVWCADISVIWDEMRICLELADRLLKASIETGFMDTLLRGVNILFPTATPMGHWHMYPNAPDGQVSYQAILDEINRLAQRLVFSFIDEDNSRTELLSRHPTGETRRVRDQEAQWFIYCGIHVRFLRVLLQCNSTPAEKTLARFGFAVTVVHELMHAIFCFQSKPYEGVSIQTFPDQEWFMFDEWVRELGCSWENHVFGGQVTLHPSFIDGKTGRGNFIFASIQEWPNPEMGNFSEKKLPGQETNPRQVYPVPTLWISYLFTQEYWDRWVPKYGPLSLRFPKVLRSTRGHTRDHAARRLRVDYQVREMRPGLREGIAALTHRRQQWWDLRPWYRKLYTEWIVSPWADVHLRVALEQYLDAHRARDEVRAQKAYEEILMSTMLKGDEIRNWYWQGIGWLMYLCLPERTTEAVVNLPDPQPGRWRRSWAAIGAGVGWEFEPLARNLETKPYTLTGRHKFGVFGDRRHSIVHAKKLLSTMEKEYPINMELSIGFWHAWALIARTIRSKELSETDWIEFDYGMTDYEGYTLDIGVDTGTIDANAYVDYSGDPLDPTKYDLSSAGTASLKGDAFDDYDSDEGAPGVRPVAKVAKLQQLSYSPRPAKYFTIGEVGEHRAHNDLWLLCEDDMSGFDVYDASGIWEKLVKEQPNLLKARMCERTKLGWVMVNSSLKKRVKEANMLLGKLMQQWVTEEEVKEMDGRNGKPLWILRGNRIFDVTDFPCQSELETSYLYFLQNPTKAGTSGMRKEQYLENLGHRAAQIHQELEQYHCGNLRAQQRRIPRERAFTANEVGWHHNADYRMYTIIQDGVYDVTDFGHFHPGGIALLEEFAGRDATQQFKDTHTNWEACLQAYEYLRIGRIVAERERDSANLGKYEVTLREAVYNIHLLKVTDKPKYQSLRQWAGTDATAVLEQQRPQVLQWLESQQNLIVAKFARPLREITLNMLAYNNNCIQPDVGGEELLQADRNLNIEEYLLNHTVYTPTDREIWVCVDDDVYCVSDLVLKGSSRDMPTGIPVWEALRNCAGKQVTDEALAKWITDYHQCRKIGKLVQGPGRREIAPKEMSGLREQRSTHVSFTSRQSREKRKRAELVDEDDGAERAIRRQRRVDTRGSVWL